jgi:hypothetical protein
METHLFIFFEIVHPRHHQVKQDDIGLACSGLLGDFSAISRAGHNCGPAPD